MGKVILDLAVSLDGYIAGPPTYPERLHDWMFPPTGEVTASNAAVIEESIRDTGAIIMGRGAYDLGDQFDGFADTPYKCVHIVLTHEPPKKPTKGDTTFIFVTDGIKNALAQARAAAGDKDIALGGGADISRQYLEAGLVDEIQIHLVPVLFGSGLRLFEHLHNAPIELEGTGVIDAAGVTHLKYRVIK